MSEEKQAQPEVTRRRRVSKVWVIPLVAAGIAVWMFASTLLGRGPSVQITFKSAEGLVAGKTVVRYKNIDVGEVLEVKLSKDLGEVIVTVRLKPSMRDHLAAGARFWVVKPRIGPGGISGLDTLLSGSYIEFDPKSGKREKEFRGLEQPPTLTGDGGLRVKLKAASLGSVDVGAQVLFRDIPVGQVESYELESDHVSVAVYIHEEFAPLVKTSTRFWQTSGVEVSMDADGFRLNTASLDSLIRGGLAFDTPEAGDTGVRAKDGTVFQLYSRREEIGEEYVGQSFEVIMYFENSVRGLRVGAPVEFRGIKVGEVTQVKLQYHIEKTWLQIPVRARIEPERLQTVGGKSPPFGKTLDVMIDRGLRAQVATGSLLTGAMFVDLDFDGDAPLKYRGSAGDPKEIPTTDSGSDELIDNAAKVLKKIEKMPIESLIREANATLATARRVVDNLDGRVGKLLASLSKTADSAELAVRNLETSVPNGAKLQAEVSRALREVGSAAASIKKLADVLAREPESLLRGRR